MHKALLSGLLGLPLLFLSCAGTPPPPPPARAEAGSPRLIALTPPRTENLILVTIDGVRWQEIFTGLDPALADAAGLPHNELRTARGLTPNLHRLFFDAGTVLGDPRIGAPFVASGPRYVSLPAYIEMMTGAPSGCDNNDCDPHPTWTIAAEIAKRGARGGTSVFSSWGTLSRAVPPGDRLFLATGRGPREEAPPYPGYGDYRPDRVTAARATHHLLTQRPRMLWIALGDTDEHAHRSDYRGYIESLRFADAFVGELCAHLDDMGSYGASTTVFVTTDHGRDENFTDHGGESSACVWLMARGRAISRRGLVGLDERRYLRDIAPTIASLYGLSGRQCEGCGSVLPELL